MSEKERPVFKKRPTIDTLPCEFCGKGPLTWIKCKLICKNCQQIILSCADMA